MLALRVLNLSAILNQHPSMCRRCHAFMVFRYRYVHVCILFDLLYLVMVQLPSNSSATWRYERSKDKGKNASNERRLWVHVAPSRPSVSSSKYVRVRHLPSLYLGLLKVQVGWLIITYEKGWVKRESWLKVVYWLGKGLKKSWIKCKQRAACTADRDLNT